MSLKLILPDNWLTPDGCESPEGHTSPIPCLLRRIDSIDWGTDYDCDYEHAGKVSCDDCIVNGGRMDPRTGRRFRRAKSKKEAP